MAVCASSPGYVENQSYATPCAEVDNINIPLYSPGVTAYRIVATHPVYYPTSIDERGPDFTDCDFADRQIWLIGEKNGANTGFRDDAGFTDPDTYYAPDTPPAGVDEPVTNFPKEINHDWMNNQFIRFTADEPGDFNHTLIIGARLEVAFATISEDGMLEIECLTGDGTNWVSHGTHIFNGSDRTATWHFPDFTWIEGVDANFIHLRVLTGGEGATTAGAWGLYDYLELHKRDETGETVVPLYDDGTNIVQGIHIDFWWRAPRAMHIHVDGGDSMTNAHYLRLIRRVPDSAPAQYDEIFILYQDANARIHPFAPVGLDPNWVPYGASVQIGATPESERPYADIQTVWVDPVTSTMDIEYEDLSMAEVRVQVDRQQSIVDVRHITYDTVTLPFARFRSMWVRDGNDDIQRVMHRLGQFPIMDQWDELPGSWWFFNRETPSYHNTYAPDFLIEILEPSPAFLERAAEAADASDTATVAAHTNAMTGSVLLFPPSGGEAEYDLDLTRPWLNVFMRLDYADVAGGTPFTVYLDETPVFSWDAAASGDTNNFVISPSIALGDLDAGTYNVRIDVGAGTSGVALDRFEWIARPEALSEEVLIAEVEHQTGPSLLNASFENGTGETIINNWTRWDGLIRDDAGWIGPRTGDWAALMQGWTLGGGIFQDVPSGGEGVEYSFSIWANPTHDWQYDHFDVSIFIQFRNNADQLIQEFSLSEEDLTGPIEVWTQYSVEGISPPGTAVVRVGMEFGEVTTNGVGAFRFDDAMINDGKVTLALAQAYSNAYISVRYAEEQAPSRVDIYMNDTLRGAFPTENTGGSNVFVWGPSLYVGALPSGTNVIDFASSGLNMDRFRLFERRRVNRPPFLQVPSPHLLVMGTHTNFPILAYDLDGDDLTVEHDMSLSGATLETNHFSWTAIPGYGGSTTEVFFVAWDPHGDPNSGISNSAFFIVPFDFDEDGLPDEWEWVHFQTLAHGPGDDIDNDGMNNYEHYIAGTQPTNPASFFHVADVYSTNTNTMHCLTIAPTMPGRKYTIYYTDDNLASNPVWQPFANSAEGVGTWTETNSTESVFTFCDDLSPDTTSGPPAGGIRIYRIRIEWPQ